MHLSWQVLDKIFSSLHRAEAGQLAEGEPDAALPQKVRVPAPGAPPSVHTNGHSAPKLGRSSLVQSLFGLEVQVGYTQDEMPAVWSVLIHIPDCNSLISLAQIALMQDLSFGPCQVRKQT